MFSVSNVECIDLGRSSQPISTGLGYLDHMLDQFNSHAQVGVAVSVSLKDGNSDGENINRFAEYPQETLQASVGAALGMELKKLLQTVPVNATSRFCCPLDEALVECIVTKVADGASLEEYTLAPFGIYPRPTGRTKIGAMQTNCLQSFMSNLAENAGLAIKLIKVRGDNGHHVCESAFKALSRALRNLLDGTSTNTDSAAMQNLWGSDSDSYAQSLQLQRSGKVERKTKETSILVELFLDGGAKGVSIETGIAALNEFWALLAKEAGMSLIIQCKGDLWVDDHHTTEDVAIAVGQVLNKALGTKAGLNRMWCADAQYGDANVEVTMDLSNRPCLTHNLTLADSGEEYVDNDALTVEMLDHALESLVMNGHMTVHIVERNVGKTVKETVFATAMAFGRALRFCAAVDPRRAGKTASSKGTLSV